MNIYLKFVFFFYCSPIVRFFVRFKVEVSPKTASQILYTCAFMLLVMRLLEFYMVGKNLGPKIILIGHMISDFGFFVLLYGILLFSYGTSVQALMYPNDPRPEMIAENIIIRPLMLLFGEMFLGEIHGYQFEGVPYPNPEGCDDSCSNASRMVNNILTRRWLGKYTKSTQLLP